MKKTIEEIAIERLASINESTKFITHEAMLKSFNIFNKKYNNALSRLAK